MRMFSAEAAELLGVTQPGVGDLIRRCLGLFSVDSLIDMLARLGVRVAGRRPPEEAPPRRLTASLAPPAIEGMEGGGIKPRPTWCACQARAVGSFEQ